MFSLCKWISYVLLTFFRSVCSSPRVASRQRGWFFFFQSGKRDYFLTLFCVYILSWKFMDNFVIVTVVIKLFSPRSQLLEVLISHKCPEWVELKFISSSQCEILGRSKLWEFLLVSILVSVVSPGLLRLFPQWNSQVFGNVLVLVDIVSKCIVCKHSGIFPCPIKDEWNLSSWWPYPNIQ